MTANERCPLPRGIVPVLQMPFTDAGAVDFDGLCRLINDAVVAGAAGFLAPVVASEVACLSVEERCLILERIAAHLKGRVPLIVGASADDPATCREMAQVALDMKASAWLVAVPQSLYQQPESIVPFFRAASVDSRLPLVIQDLQFNGPGLPLAAIKQLRAEIPTFQGIKIETVPAGPKYTAVREAFGPEFYIAGGWAVPQMIEALDRGVDAMIPESSMVRVYQAIYRRHRDGRREEAIRMFRSLLPVLAFTNQELVTSIAFFKRLLVRKGIFTGEAMRLPGFTWDAYNLRIADELIDYYLQLEESVSA